MNLPLPVAVGIWVVLGLLLLALIAIGWRRRIAATNPVLQELPPKPDHWESDETPSHEGTYITTTVGGDWLARIAARGLGNRAKSWLVLHEDGLHLERNGEETLYLPGHIITGVTLTSGMVGKFIGKDAIIAINWTWESQTFDTGFLPRHHGDTQKIMTLIQQFVPSSKETL